MDNLLGIVDIFNYKLLWVALVALIGIFYANFWWGTRHGFGYRHYWFFELMHFLGGFFVAMFLFSLYPSKKFVFLGLAAVTFIWELTEYSISKIPAFSRYFKKTLHAESTKVSLRDTSLDIFLNFAGAALFLYFFV